MTVKILIELLQLGQALTNPEAEVTIETGIKPKTVEVTPDDSLIIRIWQSELH